MNAYAPYDEQNIQALVSRMRSAAPSGGQATFPETGMTPPPVRMPTNPTGALQGPNGQRVGPTMPPDWKPTMNDNINPGGQYTPPQAKVDTSKWDVDGYATPQVTAQKPGNVLAGWDAAKWADPNHQSPKYVVGRILSQGNMKDPGQRQAAIDQILKAYPGATFDGKDALTIPGVGTADIFRGADIGEYTPQWLTSGGAPVKGPVSTTMPIPGSTVQAPPMDDSFWQQLMAKLSDPNQQHLVDDPNRMYAAVAPAAQALASQMRG